MTWAVPENHIINFWGALNLYSSSWYCTTLDMVTMRVRAGARLKGKDNIF